MALSFAGLTNPLSFAGLTGESMRDDSAVDSPVKPANDRGMSSARGFPKTSLGTGAGQAGE
jgi:hypothetical protein